MKKVLYFLAVNLFVLTLAAQPARERKPATETTKPVTETTQVLGLQSDGCNYLMVSQPPKPKRGKTTKKQEPIEPYYPERIEAYICFEPSSAYYTEEGDIFAAGVLYEYDYKSLGVSGVMRIENRYPKQFREEYQKEQYAWYVCISEQG
jgi:hypothetical protein